MKEQLKQVLDNISASTVAESQDYTDKETGLLHCGNFHTPKECRVKFFDKIKLMPCTCKCRQEQLASFGEFDLLIIDDLGIERNSEYAQEQVYNVVDSRYLSRLPFIITTNLTLAELKEPKDIAHARIYDRILERCAPVLFGGKNYRKENAESTKQAIRQIIAEQEESL